MKTIMVRYTTSKEYAEANAARVRAVFEELRVLAPVGLRYATYRLGEEGTGAFVHIATLQNAGENPLLALSSFQTFQKELREKDRCVEPPVVTELTAVGSYASGA
jgi:hypothetical protein